MGKQKKHTVVESVATTKKVTKLEPKGVKKERGSKEIDDLFSSVASKATKPKEQEDTEVKNTEVKRKSKVRSSEEGTYGIMKSDCGSEIVNPEAPLERIDAESGLPVYKAHLLKVGEGGGTPLCPFDCNCCF